MNKDLIDFYNEEYRKVEKEIQEHTYISENKKSNYQFELSKERAECIANKYNSLVKELQQENQQLRENNLSMQEEMARTWKKLDNLQEIEKEHKRINGELREENKQLKEQLEYIRNGEYYNQVRFERDMLQDLVDKYKHIVEEIKKCLMIIN